MCQLKEYKGNNRETICRDPYTGKQQWQLEKTDAVCLEYVPDLPTPKYFCPYAEQPMSVFSDFLLDFFADAPPISQNEAVPKVNYSIIHLVRTVCELTFSIIQMYYTLTTFFVYICESHSQSKTAEHFLQKQCTVCAALADAHASFLERVFVWSAFVSLVMSILPPLCRFCAATYHRQLQTHHIRRCLISIKFRCKVDVHWFNKLFWPIRTGHILQPRKWL